MMARAFLLALLAATLPQAALAGSAVRVERDLSWTKSAGSETAPATLLIFDGESEIFAIETRLKRAAAGKPVAADLDRGYRLYCGSWTRMAADRIAVQAALLESYRYPALAEKRQFAGSFTVTDDASGTIAKTLTEGSRVFEPLPSLGLGETEIARFRLACHHGQ